LHEHRAPLKQKARFSDFPRILKIILLYNNNNIIIIIQNTYIKFVYQGHGVKFKVTEAKGHTSVTKYIFAGGSLSIQRGLLPTLSVQ